MMDLDLLGNVFEVLINNSLAVALVMFFIITSYFKDKKAALDHEALVTWIRTEMTTLLQHVATVASAAAEAIRANTAVMERVSAAIEYCERRTDDNK